MTTTKNLCWWCRIGGHLALTKQKDAEKNKCSVAPCFQDERLKFSELRRFLFGPRVIKQKTPRCTGRWWKRRKNRNICCVADAEVWLSPILGPYLSLWQTTEPEGPEQQLLPQLALDIWIIPGCFITKVSQTHESLLKSCDSKRVQTQPRETGFICFPPRTG